MTRPDRPVTEDDLHAWVDELLSPERRSTVETWLNANPEAYRKVLDWRKERDLLRVSMSADLGEPVPARFDLTELKTRRFRTFNALQIAASIVLALSVGFGGGWFLREREIPLGLASVEQEATIVHASSEGSAIIEGNVVQLAAWGGSTTGRSVRPPDLSASGYQLTKGQLVTTDRGPACIFFYKDKDGTSISLFIRPMYGRDMTAPMRPMKHLPGYVWAQDGLGISLISDASVLGLHNLANHARDLMAERRLAL